MEAEAKRRLMEDLKRLSKDSPPGVSAEPCEENLFKWDAIICGPGETPFEGGSFRLKIEFPPEYPHKAPTVFFYSRMFHPNVYPNGKICLDILEMEEEWKPEYDASAVLCAVQSMLGDPNPDSPANGEANELFVNNPEEYENRVRQIVYMSEIEEDADEEEANKNLNEEDEQEAVRLRVEDLLLSEELLVDGFDPDTLTEFLSNK